MAHPKRVVSAPGKVMVTGGYLVLDRKHTCLVFGLDARIHVLIQPLTTGAGVSLSEISVRSPQFRDASWEYGYRLTEMDGGIEVTQLTASASTSRRNPFIETALSYALTYIASYHSETIEPASITVLADNDYYSKPGEAPGAGFDPSGDRFRNFNVPLWEAHKTGLGSSAALVTAFTAALLVHYLPEEQFSLSTDQGKRRLHNLAQAAHCAAQGKVGSGFDIASAVYGSCLYRRFSPSLLQSHGEPGSPGFLKELQRLVDEPEDRDRWDTEIMKSAVEIPKGLRWIMCDVNCGSQTPGMVKQVLAWRKEHPDEADQLWDTLQQKNDALASELVRLTGDSSGGFSTLKQRIEDIRQLVREMSAKSGVPIEPKEQTALLDGLSSLHGVLGGMVPGAGGYDAVALLIEDSQEVVTRVDDFLEALNAQGGAGAAGEQTTVTIGRATRLGVRGEMEGVRMEDASLYGNWAA